MKCEKCLELQSYLRITTPKLLEDCEVRAKEFIKIGILHLEKDNSWSSDYIEKIYSCRFCGIQYILCAETYHGQGGEWKIIDK